MGGNTNIIRPVRGDEKGFFQPFSSDFFILIILDRRRLQHRPIIDEPKLARLPLTNRPMKEGLIS